MRAERRATHASVKKSTRASEVGSGPGSVGGRRVRCRREEIPREGETKKHGTPRKSYRRLQTKQTMARTEERGAFS